MLSKTADQKLGLEPCPGRTHQAGVWALTPSPAQGQGVGRGPHSCNYFRPGIRVCFNLLQPQYLRFTQLILSWMLNSRALRDSTIISANNGGAQTPSPPPPSSAKVHLSDPSSPFVSKCHSISNTFFCYFSCIIAMVPKKSPNVEI